MAEELPDPVADEAERLTRLARRAVDGNEARAYRERRDEILSEHGYTARVREESTGAVLVCHPAAWIEDGTADLEAIDDVDRGVERRLEGTGEPDEWETVAERNDDVVEQVVAEAGEAHRTNVRALADFAGNHYAKPIPELTREELREFRAEYYQRNVWPSDAERELLESSIRLAYGATETACPLDR